MLLFSARHPKPGCSHMMATRFMRIDAVLIMSDFVIRRKAARVKRRLRRLARRFIIR
jgi:hypothetical protein